MRELPNVSVRMDMELRERLQSAAYANGRSLSSEAIHRLRLSFEQEHAGQASAPAQPTASAASLSAAELALLKAFRSMAHKQQMGLQLLLRIDD